MSIGNLKDEGNKGNNFPFQLKVLQGLQAVVDGNCCQDIVALLQDIEAYLRPGSRRVNVASSTGAGSTPAGAFSASIANVGTAAGTVNGISIPAGTTLNFDAGVLNSTLGSITYDATGTTFIVTYIQ